MPQRHKHARRKRKIHETEMDISMPDAKRAKTSSPSAGATAAMKRALQRKYHTKFSWSFFKFWDWLQLFAREQSIATLSALECIDLRLVGPFEFLHGALDTLSDEQILVHHRYHFDLPEFQTVVLSTDASEVAEGIHYGLWRDDPKQNAVGIARAKGDTEPKKNSKALFEAMEPNLFLFVARALSEHCKAKNKKGDAAEKIEALQTSLRAFMALHGITQRAKDGFAGARSKLVVSRSAHGLGLVVPMRGGDVGYRPIGYSSRELQRILGRMHRAKAKGAKVDATEMEVILTNVCLADDEGDPGMGYELGIAFFCSWPMFHRRALRLLSNAYALTEREGFDAILNAHCKVRATQNGHYDQLLSVKKESKGGDAKITKFFAKPKPKEKTEVEQKKKESKQQKKSLDELSSDEE